MIFGVYYLPNVVSSLAAGVLASVYGRRRVLSAGCATLSAGCVAIGLVPPARARAAMRHRSAPRPKQIRERLSIALHERPGMQGFDGPAGGQVPVVCGPELLFAGFIAARLLQGCGCALAQTCLFAMLADLWPEHTGKVMGTAELCAGTAYAIGPPLGGLLLALGGFSAPFIWQASAPRRGSRGVLSWSFGVSLGGSSRPRFGWSGATVAAAGAGPAPGAPVAGD